MIRHLKRKSEFEDIALYTTKIRHVKKKKKKKKGTNNEWAGVTSKWLNICVTEVLKRDERNNLDWNVFE